MVDEQLVASKRCLAWKFINSFMAKNEWEAKISEILKNSNFVRHGTYLLYSSLLLVEEVHFLYNIKVIIIFD